MQNKIVRELHIGNYMLMQTLILYTHPLGQF